MGITNFFFYSSSGGWYGLQGYAYEEKEATEKSCGGKNAFLTYILHI